MCASEMSCLCSCSQIPNQFIQIIIQSKVLIQDVAEMIIFTIVNGNGEYTEMI